MTEMKNPLARNNKQPAASRTIIRHAFAVGQVVKVLPSAFGRKSKDVEKSLYADDFQVTRLLPEEASSFQYRIKNVATGQERVAAESELSAAGPVQGAFAR